MGFQKKMKLFSHSSSPKRRRSDNPLILISFSVQDLDYLIKLVNAEKQLAAEELHQFAMQSNQQGQRKANERFKGASSMEGYLKDRFETWLNGEEMHNDGD